MHAAPFFCLLQVLICSSIPNPRSPAFPRLHADGKAETDESDKGDEVEGRGDGVEEAEFLVGIVHSGRWL